MDWLTVLGRRPNQMIEGFGYRGPEEAPRERPEIVSALKIAAELDTKCSIDPSAFHQIHFAFRCLSRGADLASSIA